MATRKLDLHDEIAPNLHPILGAALAAIPESARPSPPFHLDGPRPKLTVQGMAEAALVCARHVRPRARADAAECDRLIGLLARAVADDGPRDAPWRADLRGARTIREHARGALKVTALACEAAYEDALRGMQRLQSAVGLAMRLLDAEARNALVVALDRAIVVSEARELARRAGLERGVVEVVARLEGRVLVAHDDGTASWLELGDRGRWTARTDTLAAREPEAPRPAQAERVVHARFGVGEIVGRDPGPPEKVQVRFADAVRWLLADRVCAVAAENAGSGEGQGRG